VTDPHGHGTKVASVIGADSNNATGMAGIVWNTNLVSLRVADSSGRAYSSWTIAAINYATSAGIPILNLSAAWTSLSATDQYDEPLNECIENYPGLIVCAAGNNSADLAYNNYYSYPSEFTASNLLVVGSSTQNDTIAEHSNYGAVSVDLFAPGEGIYMAKRTGGYTTDVGTSFAAPHVTGVAALLLFECNTITVARMKSVILNRTDKLSAFTSNCVSGGRLNAYKALTNAHLYSYTRTATTHTGTCSCGETKTEPHNFIQIGDRSLCPDCGYKRSTNPVRSN
jgi:subtilisin family serine protease